MWNEQAGSSAVQAYPVCIDIDKDETQIGKAHTLQKTKLVEWLAEDVQKERTMLQWSNVSDFRNVQKEGIFIILYLISFVAVFFICETRWSFNLLSFATCVLL